MTGLILYLALALGVSFLCSLVESTILSLSRADVAKRVKENRTGGQLLARMKDKIERPLAAILTLNTVSHTIGAAGVGAEALKIWGEPSVAIASAVLTVLMLVFTEIIPKTLGAVYARRLAGVTAYIIQAMIIVSYPLVIVFQALGRLIAPRGETPQLTREEFAFIAELGHAEGALHQKEYRVIRNLLRLNRIIVRQVMTPRTVVFMLSKDMTVQQVVDAHPHVRFSRIPLFGDGPDDIAGLVMRHDILEAAGNDRGAMTLAEIGRPIHAVPEMAMVGQVLNEFVVRREQLFLVVDEHGGTGGIVTLEDAVETLLGVEIVDETDTVADMRQLAYRIHRDQLHGRKF